MARQNHLQCGTRPAIQQLFLEATVGRLLFFLRPSFFPFVSPSSSYITALPPPCWFSTSAQTRATHVTSQVIRFQVKMDSPVNSSKRKRSEEDAGLSERPTAPHLPQDWNRNSEAICEQCSQVDWSSVPTLAIHGLLRDCIRELRTINESHRQLAASSCRVCRILSLIKSPSLDQRQCMVYAKELSKQWSSSAVYLPGSYRYTVLSIASKAYNTWPAEYPRCLVALTRYDDKVSYMIHPRSINYDKLKHLARSCEASHGSFCTDRSLHQVPGLRVIDVSSRMVVEAPENCRYLALSYVWGQQPGPTNGDTLHCAPPLIEDAITVTISLDYNYLWVDRYVGSSQFMSICLSNSDLT